MVVWLLTNIPFGSRIFSGVEAVFPSVKAGAAVVGAPSLGV
jgi:hypothetical protein